jgi:hypothetical protein
MEALHALASKVDPTAFAMSFGAPIEKLDELVQANTVTIEKLLALAPPGTPDPSAGLYNSTMYAMAALLLVALLANALIKPVVGSHYVENAPHQS